jgi:hypothetical protein
VPPTPTIVLVTATPQPTGVIAVQGRYTTRAQVGQTISWVFTVQNTGTSAINGLSAGMDQNLTRFTLIGCLPACTYDTLDFILTLTTFSWKTVLVPGGTRMFTVNLSPNEPGNIGVTWTFRDGANHALKTADGSDVGLTGEVAVFR